MSKLVKFDWAIKHLLRHKVNFDVLEGFLSELLKQTIKIEHLLESEGNKDHERGKFNRVDVLALTEDKKRVIIEVQCHSEADYLSRILYATSKVICEHVKEGEKFSTVPKVISVNIVYFEIGQGQDYLYHGTTAFRGMHYQDTLELNEKEQAFYAALTPSDRQSPETIYPEYYLIKIPAFHDKIKDKIDEWIYFLKHDEIKKTFNARGIQSAAKKLDFLNLDEKGRHAYSHYQDLLHSDASFVYQQKFELEFAEKKGRQEGRQEGLQEGRQEGLQKQLTSARRLIQRGFSPEEIMAILDLSSAEMKIIARDVETQK